MFPFVAVAALLVGAALYVRSRSAPPPPAGSVSLEGTGTDVSADNTGLGEMMAGGSAGGVIGSVIGLFIGLVGKILQESMSTWPWLKSGLPFVPGRWQSDGSVKILVPSQEGDGTYELTLSRELIAREFPAEPCLNSAKAAGVFAWRPGDVETPVSRIIYAACPWLADYEAEHFQSDNPPRPTWQELRRNYETQSGSSKVSVVHFANAKNPELTDGAYIPGALHSVRRIAWCVASDGLPWTLDALESVYADFEQRMTSKDWKYLGFIPVPDVVADPLGKVLMGTVRGSVNEAKKVATVIASSISRGYRGMPGAWRRVEMEPTHTVGAQGATTATAADGTTATLRSGTLGRVTYARVPGSAVVGASTVQAAPTSLPGAFRFECWIPRTGFEAWPVVLDLSDFGAGAEAELKAGRLVWGPNTRADYLALWLETFPWLDSSWAENMRKG